MTATGVGCGQGTSLNPLDDQRVPVMVTTTLAVVGNTARGVGPSTRAWLVGQEMALTLDAAPVSASRARHASGDALAGWGCGG